MLFFKKNKERHSVFRVGLAIGLMASLVSVWFCDSVSARIGGISSATVWPSDVHKRNQNTYRSPEGAVAALVAALSANDEKRLSAILGPGGKKPIFSGNQVDERAARESFVQAYREKNRIIRVSSREAILETGNEDRPFPIPIEKVGKHWRFSAKRGMVELLKPPDQQN
ncbi:conserved exported hypothetical protein [Syntrophobacter sp. SbD1]|nr:conserved exported hypothetical protein [Syntrophobacter sp. SbD1]